MVDHGQRQFLGLGSQDTDVYPDADQYGIVCLLAPISIDAVVALQGPTGRHAHQAAKVSRARAEQIPHRSDSGARGLGGRRLNKQRNFCLLLFLT